MTDGVKGTITLFETCKGHEDQNNQHHKTTLNDPAQHGRNSLLILLAHIEQIRPRSTEIDDFGTSISILFQPHTFSAIIRIRYSR